MKEITMIKTNEGCFMNDCKSDDKYEIKYHNSILKGLLFDGKYPKETYSKNWYLIEKYPEIIEEKEKDTYINQRYVLKDEDLKSDKLPLVLKYDELDSEDDRYSLYSYERDIKVGELKVITPTINVIIELDNFVLPPNFSYKTIVNNNYKKGEYIVSNVDIKHQMLDKIIIPSVLLHDSICELETDKLYDIIRFHVQQNIDIKISKITSNYDFCFEVKKLLPLFKPETISYTNPFESTKKKRNKIYYKTLKYREETIFEMTNTREYKGYTMIKPITANNETELKNKLDKFLKDLMFYINKKITPCPNCEGKGYLDEIKVFN